MCMWLSEKCSSEWVRNIGVEMSMMINKRSNNVIRMAITIIMIIITITTTITITTITTNVFIPGCRVKVEISFPFGLLSLILSANSLVNKMLASFELP